MDCSEKYTEYFPYIRRVSHLNIDDVSERKEAFEAANTIDLGAIKDGQESMLVAANLVLVNLVLTVILVISLCLVCARGKSSKIACMVAFVIFIVQAALAIVAIAIGMPLASTFVEQKDAFGKVFDTFYEFDDTFGINPSNQMNGHIKYRTENGQDAMATTFYYGIVCILHAVIGIIFLCCCYKKKEQ